MARADIPYDSLGYCKSKRHPRSVIKHKREVQTRGRQATACFFFIVKSDIKIFVSSTDKSNDFYLVCRGDHRSSDVVSVIAAHPSVIQTKNLYLIGRGGACSSRILSKIIPLGSPRGELAV